MMYDRPYMTNTHQDRARKTLIWLIGANVVIWALQNVAIVFGGEDMLSKLFGLSRESLANGMIWTPLTYSFLHSPTGIMHLLGNMLGLFFLGRSLLPLLGQKRFLQLYAIGALAGGLLWFIVSFVSGSGLVLGASAAVFALFIFFACLYPNTEIQILLFFILPIRVKPKYVAWTLLFISGAGLLFNELARNGQPIAHSAHLGGMLGGYLFYRFVYARNPYASDSGIQISVPRFFRKRPAPKTRTESYRYSVNVSQTPDLKKEVDRILDKINSKGFGSLSPDEKKTLDEARDLLRRR